MILTQMCVCVCVCTCTYICTCEYIWVNAYIYIYIHTHTYVNINIANEETISHLKFGQIFHLHQKTRHQGCEQPVGGNNRWKWIRAENLTKHTCRAYLKDIIYPNRSEFRIKKIYERKSRMRFQHNRSNYLILLNWIPLLIWHVPGCIQHLNIKNIILTNC